MVGDPFEKDITFTVRSHGRRLHVTVTNDVLTSRFGADASTEQINNIFARYAGLVTWMASGKAFSEGSDVVLVDRGTFDLTEAHFLSAGALAKAKDPLCAREAVVLARECLRDTTSDETHGSLDLAAAISLFLVRAPRCAPPGIGPCKVTDAQAWIFYVMFQDLEMTTPARRNT